MIFLLQDTGQDQNFFALNFSTVCKWYCVFRELDRARTSSPQMFYIYVNDIYISYKALLSCPV